MPRSPEIVNRVVSDMGRSKAPFSTGNLKKQEEIAKFYNLPPEKMDFVNLDIDEIQSVSPEEVAAKKAIAAYEQYGQPVIVEDTSLSIPSLSHLLAPTFEKFWARDRQTRKAICNMLADDNREAYAQVTFAVFDGHEVQIRKGLTEGKIAGSPIGRDDFGWDDIFIPQYGDGRTYSQMSLEEKNETSPRIKALHEINEQPFNLEYVIHMMQEPYRMQMKQIRKEILNQEIARRFAFSLSGLREGIENHDFRVNQEDLLPFHMEEIVPDSGIYTFKLNLESPDLGLMYTPMDIKRNDALEPRRLDIYDDDFPKLRQRGPVAYERALASRAHDFLVVHREKTYKFLREVQEMHKKGERYVPPRANRRSALIEEIIGLEVDGKRPTIPEFSSNPDSEYQQILTEVNEKGVATKAASIEQIAYARKYSPRKMSRTAAARAIWTDATGIPSSIFANGGMPPVTGSKDFGVTSAALMRQFFIPHNSVYVNNIERQLRMFVSIRDEIMKLGLPSDIEALSIAHIGVAFGTNSSKVISRNVKLLQNEGCSLMRMYTTNPDYTKVDAVKAMRQTGQDNLRICVGPIVDMDEGKLLVGNDIQVNTVYGGHGGGENCTSIDDGNGAYTGLELLYMMSINPQFNKVAIGLEGGTGNAYGELTGIIDVISRNGSAIAGGGVESTGGLSFVHVNQRSVISYPGSASIINLRTEAEVSEKARERILDDAGRVINEEGKPGYSTVVHHIYSVTDAWTEDSKVMGKVLADQNLKSIREARVHYNNEGYDNGRIGSESARALAKPHQQNRSKR